MDTAVAIRTLEATYKSSADAASVETMILKLTEKVCYNGFISQCWIINFRIILKTLLISQEGPALKSKGKASNAIRVAVLTWRSLLVVSREWKYYWLHLILYMLLTLCIGTVFSGLGHSLSSVVVSLDIRIAYILYSLYIHLYTPTVLDMIIMRI